MPLFGTRTTTSWLPQKRFNVPATRETSRVDAIRIASCEVNINTNEHEDNERLETRLQILAYLDLKCMGEQMWARGMPLESLPSSSKTKKRCTPTTRQVHT
jgi:hypothetical protein